METSLLDISVPRSLIFFMFSDCGFLYSFSSAAKGGFSDDG